MVVTVPSSYLKPNYRFHTLPVRSVQGRDAKMKDIVCPSTKREDVNTFEFNGR